MSSRSSTFCSPLGASSRASGGCAYAPLRFFSAGTFSGSDSGKVGSTATGAGRLIDGGVGREAAARNAAAAAPTTAAAREGLGASSAGGVFAAAFARRRRRQSEDRPSSSSSSRSSLTAATRGATLAGFTSFVALSAPDFSRCFFTTSWRCCSRRRSSFRARMPSSMLAQRSRAIWKSAPNRRPNENCVDRTIERKRSVRIRMIEPVLFK